MGKKKRQEFHTAAFLEKPKDQEGVKSCSHIGKSIVLARLKPKRNPKLQQRRLGILDSPATEDKEQFWICLKCGQLDCGRKQHTDNKPATLHCISFNITTKKAWCNVCNIQFEPKDNQKINRALQHLQQHLEDTSEDYETAKIGGKIFREPEEMEEHFREREHWRGVVKSNLYTPRGLKNLGNTCYFNVVLQCLARTPNFISQMEKLREDKIITLEEKAFKEDSETMNEISCKTDKWMDFSDLLLKSLEELNIPDKRPHIPIKLLNELYRVSSTITKDEQHDAHELLREVLQKIKDMDIERFKSAILKNLRSPCAGKENIEDRIRQIFKTYGNDGTRKTFFEDIFGGTLISTLKCQECGKTSYTSETFLDLSLPISDITSFEMTVNKQNPNLKKKQKKMQPADVTKDSPQKCEKTGQRAADVEESFEADAEHIEIEKSEPEVEKLEYHVGNILSNGREEDSSVSPVTSCINGEKIMAMSTLCGNNMDTTSTTTTDIMMSAAEGAESKEVEHKGCMQVVNSSRANTTPAVPIESITSTVKEAEIKNGEQEEYMSYLPISPSCSTNADTMVSTSVDKSNCIGNTAEVAESKDKDQEDCMKNLVATTLYRESTGSPLSDRDTPSPVSSEMNIDCSTSIRMHAGCSSPVSPDCNGDRPVSRFEFCDDRDVARCSPISELNSISMKAAMNDFDSKSSNHVQSPGKLSITDEIPCNDSEFLGCPGEGSMTIEHSEIDLNQTEILEDIKKLNLSDENNAASYVSQNETDTKGKLSPKGKDKKRKNMNTRPTEDKSPDYDASKFTLKRCLENFTAQELMTDSEKVACSQCTEKNGKGDTVLTNSTKQMQIKFPPGVLILHLKRFEVKADGGNSNSRRSSRPKKLNRHIQFPLVLDVTPYIYREKKEKVNQLREREILYSLYAVIEHTGSINQGHYIAYIKSKASKPDSSRMKDVNGNDYERYSRMALPTKWFSISDETVHKVEEKDVLKSQAYILFYEKCS